MNVEVEGNGHGVIEILSTCSHAVRFFLQILNTRSIYYVIYKVETQNNFEVLLSKLMEK
jgi:hypothetical protein